MGGTGGLGKAQKAEIKAAGTGHCGRLGGLWEAQGDWGRHRRLRARLWGTGDYGGAPRIMGGSHS